jgi:HD-like signal output (HDOD) protein
VHFDVSATPDATSQPAHIQGRSAMTVWERVTANARLVTLPEVYLRLRELVDQPDFSMADVALLIGQDPALTTRLLRLVNSPYFGLVSKIDTAFRAVSMLGVRQVHDLVLATSVARSFSDQANDVMDLSTFWQCSLLRGLLARELARTTGQGDGDGLFIAGLLADIGHMIMYQTVPGPCRQALATAVERDQPLYLAEREIIGIDHARVGGMLMRQWQLPPRLREATEFQVEPRRALEFPRETCIVHIATLLSTATRTDREFGSGALAPQPYSLEITGLTVQQLLDVQASLAAEAHRAPDALLQPS